MPPYFQAPCRVTVGTRASDIDRDDFTLAVSAVVDNPGEFDVTVTISPKDLFTDIASFTSAGNVNIYSDDDPETSIGADTGPNTSGAPTNLQFTFQDVVQTLGNTGNTWTMVIANLVVITKDGESHTISSLTMTFPSPL